jgi:hypothetical protein
VALLFTDNSLDIIFRNYKEHVVGFNHKNLKTIRLNDFPVSLKISYYEEVLVIGTQLGRIDVYDYFNPTLLDYQIIHSSPVLAIELEHKHKDGRDKGVDF